MNKRYCLLCQNQIRDTRLHKYCRECSDALSHFSSRDRTREAVRIRDKRACRQCHIKWVSGKRRFDVHHLNGKCGKLTQSYDTINKLKGLITLCHSCHIGLESVRRKISEGVGNRTNDKNIQKVKILSAILSARKISKKIGLSLPTVQSILNGLLISPKV